MKRRDAVRARTARSLAGVMAAIAVTAVSVSTASAAPGSPAAGGAPAAWRVDFDRAADGQDPAPRRPRRPDLLAEHRVHRLRRRLL